MLDSKPACRGFRIALRHALASPCASRSSSRTCWHCDRGAPVARRRSRGSRVTRRAGTQPAALDAACSSRAGGTRGHAGRAARRARRGTSIPVTPTCCAPIRCRSSPAATTCCSRRRVDDLDADEAAALIATLNAPFRRDGLAFDAPRAGRVVRHRRRAPRRSRRRRLRWCAARSIRTCRAASDARPWRRWLTEMQMLLHEHPVNAAREARGRAPVTGVWFSGGGRARADAAACGTAIVRAARCAPATSRAAWRARIGRRVAAPAPRDFAAMLATRGRARSSLLAAASTSDVAALRRTGSRRPSRRSSAARIASLDAGRRRQRRRGDAGTRRARACTAARAARAASPRPFVPPQPDAGRRVTDRRSSAAPSPPAARAGRRGHARRCWRASTRRAASRRRPSSTTRLPRCLRHATLRGIDEAAAAPRRARSRARERIVIVADYDADGATACAVGVRGLRAMGADVDFIVPNRFEYRLRPDAGDRRARRAARSRASSSPSTTASRASTASPPRPRAASTCWSPTITCPARRCRRRRSSSIRTSPAARFPSKHIAGVGVMFYVLLAHARAAARAGAFAGAARAESRRAARPGRARHRGRRRAARPDQPHLRRAGSGAHSRRPRAARRARAVRGRRPRRARARPRSTWASSPVRASTPPAGWPTCRSASAACSPTTDGEALPLARASSTASTASGATSRRRCRRRRSPTSTSRDAPARTSARCACSGRSGTRAWSASSPSRLKDRFHRPAIVFARGGDGELRGSGRSIAGFHLRDALDLVAKRAPGHDRALRRPRLRRRPDAAPKRRCRAFAAAFEAVARERLTPAQLAPHLRDRRRARARAS